MKSSTFILRTCLAFTIAVGVFSRPVWSEEKIPTHLELGRSLLSSITPENTSYRHKSQIRWTSASGDLEVHTDCSGLLNNLLDKAGSPSLERLRQMSIKRRPHAEDYYELIMRQDGFKRISRLQDVQPGDIIAIRYPPGSGDTGHVMLIDASPILRNRDTAPLIDRTRQWEVIVIDSSKSPHGTSDTRYLASGKKYDGVGRGIVRIYADEAGVPTGYSWSTAQGSNYQDTQSRPIAIGRTDDPHP